MGKVHTKTVTDSVAVTDPEDQPVQLIEFCMTAHVHFPARDIQHAVELIAEHFRRVAAGEGDESSPFESGHLNVGRAAVSHIEIPEVTH